MQKSAWIHKQWDRDYDNTRKGPLSVSVYSICVQRRGWGSAQLVYLNIPYYTHTDMSHRFSWVNFSWIPLDCKKPWKLHPHEKYSLYGNLIPKLACCLWVCSSIINKSERAAQTETCTHKRIYVRTKPKSGFLSGQLSTLGLVNVWYSP